MIDSVLDWEHDLPEPFFSQSVTNSKRADLSIVLGSSLQIQPANKLPTYSTQTVIINLSKTKMDKKANIIINAKCDKVLTLLMERLEIAVPDWKVPLVIEHSMHDDVKCESKSPAKPKTGRKRKSEKDTSSGLLEPEECKKEAKSENVNPADSVSVSA